MVLYTTAQSSTHVASNGFNLSKKPGFSIIQKERNVNLAYEICKINVSIVSIINIVSVVSIFLIIYLFSINSNF